MIMLFQWLEWNANLKERRSNLTHMVEFGQLYPNSSWGINATNVIYCGKRKQDWLSWIICSTLNLTPSQIYQVNMADSKQCLKFKEQYDECFKSWYQDYYKDKSAAKENLSVCNNFLISYKACINKVLSDDFLQTPPGMRSIKYR